MPHYAGQPLVRSNEKKVGNTHLRGRVRRGGSKGGAGDRSSRRLRNLSGKLGNDAVSGKLSEGSQAQAAMLDHIVERLEKIQKVQGVELSQIGDVRKWFRENAKNQAGYHTPDPTRWHEVTRLYMQAAEALCAGNLSRGSQLLERAAEVEQATFATLPTMVQQRLQDDEKSAATAPEEAAENITSGNTTRCARPAELAVGKQILAVQDTIHDAPPLPAKKQHWWEELEEEEEEEEGEDG